MNEESKIETPQNEQAPSASRCYAPGPWRVDQTVALGAHGVWADHDVNPSGQSQVCSVFADNKSDFSRETRDANARLIAAAPELFESLKLLLQLTNPLMQHDEREVHQARSKAQKLVDRVEA